MTELYIVGGQQKENAIHEKEWHKYKQGIVLQLDLSKNTTHSIYYQSPPHTCPSKNSAILFKASTIYNRKIYLCTQTEIVIFDLCSWKQVNHISLPCFNDIHYVYPLNEEELLIVNTGLDMVLHISTKGEIIKEWDVLGEKTWEKFSQKIDYRKVETTKPHKSHPNYLFLLKNDIWVTRFHQKDAICLNNFDKKIAINIGYPHDGIIYDEEIYFTTVNGYIVTACAKTLKIKNTYNLNEINNVRKNLGWCRGIHIIDKNLVLIGFSRIRPTKFRENLQWLKYKVTFHERKGLLPTRIALYNLSEKKLLWEFNVEEKGVNAIFSILTTSKLETWKNKFTSHT